MKELSAIASVKPNSRKVCSHIVVPAKWRGVDRRLRGAVSWRARERIGCAMGDSWSCLSCIGAEEAPVSANGREEVCTSLLRVCRCKRCCNNL